MSYNGVKLADFQVIIMILLNIKDIIFFLNRFIKYKTLSTYNCLTKSKNVNAKYCLIYLLFFIPMLNIHNLSMIKYGKIQSRMLWMQLDTNVSFLYLQLKGFFLQVKNVQNNGKSVKQHILQKKIKSCFSKMI